MKRSSVLGICVALALAAAQWTDSVYAQSERSNQRSTNDHEDHDNRGRGNAPVSVTVSFGVGLNTAQPGNAVNHHVLPRVIEVKAGGVVNFAVGGFHQIFVYNPGKGVDDVKGVNDTSFFIDDRNGLYYEGILPAGGPPPGIPATTNPSNAVNRMETIGFFEPGVYLVICNVRGHFTDGMWAFVRVTR
jgi:hypothetical protein